MSIGEIVMLTNRTSKVLYATWNGRAFRLDPHKATPVNWQVVNFAMRQLMLMGTKNPYAPDQFVSLVGVEGYHDISPITDEMLLAASKKEGIDRSLLNDGLDAADVVRTNGFPTGRAGTALSGVNPGSSLLDPGRFN